MNLKDFWRILLILLMIVIISSANTGNSDHNAYQTEKCLTSVSETDSTDIVIKSIESKLKQIEILTKQLSNNYKNEYYD